MIDQIAPNNRIHADSKKQSDEGAALFTAGDAGRSQVRCESCEPILRPQVKRNRKFD